MTPEPGGGPPVPAPGPRAPDGTPGDAAGPAERGAGRRVSLNPVRVVGVDPGRTVGIAYLTWYPREGWDGQQQVFELSADAALRKLGGDICGLAANNRPQRWIFATERFVHRRRAGRLKRLEHARQPVELERLLRQLAVQAGWRTVTRSKSEVSQWASPARLRAAGLWDPTRGRRHARDAARHALFAAVTDGFARDPLIAWCPLCRTTGHLIHDHSTISPD